MIRTVAKTSTATLMLLTLGTDEPIDCEFNMRMLNQSSICLMKSGTFHTQWTALEDAITVSDMPLEASRQHSGQKGHEMITKQLRLLQFNCKQRCTGSVTTGFRTKSLHIRKG